MMTGASPNTEWLRDCVALDDKGFVLTGLDLTPEMLAEAKWPLARPPTGARVNYPRKSPGGPGLLQGEILV